MTKQLKPKRRVMTKAVLDEISAVDFPAQVGAKAVLRKRNQSVESNPADSSAPNHAGNSDMTPEQILALQKRADRAEKAMKLSAAEREIFLAKSSEADQDAFLQLDETSRLVEVQKAASNNPVVYKDSKGREFRKSDDSRLVEMAKDADEARRDRARAEETSRQERISKRAAELKHLPGEASEHLLLVEAVEKMADNEHRTKVYALLNGLDAKFAEAFVRKGTTASNSEKESTETKLQNLAKAMRAADPKLTEAQAYAKALSTDEGKILYEQHRQGV